MDFNSARAEIVRSIAIRACEACGVSLSNLLAGESAKVRHVILTALRGLGVKRSEIIDAGFEPNDVDYSKNYADRELHKNVEFNGFVAKVTKELQDAIRDAGKAWAASVGARTTVID